jgi:hypothetical protein
VLLHVRLCAAGYSSSPLAWGCILYLSLFLFLVDLVEVRAFEQLQYQHAAPAGALQDGKPNDSWRYSPVQTSQDRCAGAMLQFSLQQVYTVYRVQQPIALLPGCSWPHTLSGRLWISKQQQQRMCS